jgi:two-component system, OmpR family, KDP operon response regulator KdpE
MNETVTAVGTTHVPKVFVVCNRPDTAVVWGYILREKGLSVILEASLENAMDHWSAEMPDLVVIDVDADPQDLLHIYQGFRAVSAAPILLLIPTHHETLILDAYMAGVDDVIVKPVSPAVFQAKILAWARRSWAVSMVGLSLVQTGRHRLDPARRCLVDTGGREVRLTNLEFQLLHLLMSKPGDIFDADELIQSIWGVYGSGDHILLKNVVYRLRRKIEADPGHPVHLITWPGGYSYQA